MSFVNKNFFKTQISNIFIRTMTSSFKIRDLNTNRHENWKYVICDIYLSNIKNDKNVALIIRREIHLIENLKINILLDNNIIKTKKFFIDIIKRQISIFNIDVIISLKIKFLKQIIQRSIHIKKTIIVSSYNEITISINYVNLLNTRNFLFELNNNINLSIYVYLINASITLIIIRNDKNLSIMIFKNTRLKRTIEIDFSNAFYINNNENVKYLIVKKSKFSYTNEWFKKLIFVYIVTYVVVVAIITFINSFLSKIFTFVFNIFLVVYLTILLNATIKKIFANFFVDFTKKFFANIFVNFTKIVLKNEIIIYNFENNNFFVKIVQNYSTF